MAFNFLKAHLIFKTTLCKKLKKTFKTLNKLTSYLLLYLACGNIKYVKKWVGDIFNLSTCMCIYNSKKKKN